MTKKVMENNMINRILNLLKYDHFSCSDVHIMGYQAPIPPWYGVHGGLRNDCCNESKLRSLSHTVKLIHPFHLENFHEFFVACESP